MAGYKYEREEKVNSRPLEQKCSTGEIRSFGAISDMWPCCSVNVKQKGGTMDFQRTLRKCHPGCLRRTSTHTQGTHAHTHTLTWMAEESLERERPSRSVRLGERMEDCGVVTGAGATEGHTQTHTHTQTENIHFKLTVTVLWSFVVQSMKNKPLSFVW